jgi:serine/threonine protein kinase
MGADGSKLTSQGRSEQTELLMEQNVEIAKRLSQEHGANKKKHDAMLHGVGKHMFARMKFKNDGAAAQNQMKPIEIEDETYEIIDFISEGGFGKVYKAQVQNKNRIVAIKIMTNTPNIREEIQNEIRFLTLTKKVSLDDHPIINYYGCKFTKEKIYIAMELASCDLATFWLTQVAHAEPENKFLLGITIIVYVLRALTFLEKLNIIHGDIKPQNLVVVPRNECFYVKLIDFGTVEKMNTLRAQISVDATKAHTVFFASPEFLKRDSNNVMARHLHKKSDAWAAGVMFYILFFDRLPWRDQFEYENFCNDSTARDVVVPRQGGYKAIIELLLKKNPEKRSSAKATLMQMKGHPALRNIIESLHEDFCPVDDVCHMRVSDDVRNELGKNNTIFIQDNY